MRILNVTPYYFPEVKFGGPPRKIHALSVALRGRRHSVNVLTLHFERPFSRERWILMVSLSSISLGQEGSFASFQRVWDQWLRAYSNTDIVHLYGLYNLICPIAAWISHAKGTPDFLEPHRRALDAATEKYPPRTQRRLAPTGIRQ